VAGPSAAPGSLACVSLDSIGNAPANDLVLINVNSHAEQKKNPGGASGVFCHSAFFDAINRWLIF
jgi:hypothetical protein